MHAVETVLLVLLLGALTGIVARYIRAIPLPLIQIALGALIAWPQAGLHIAFDPELFLLLFIPPLLFADGWRIPKREFFALAKPILLLALGLVLFTVLGLGYLIHWMIPEIPLTVAFALAAVISPTDAVAVSAITRNLGMPEKTMHVLEGESLLNDASGLVALKFAIAATLTGMFSWGEVAKEFTWMAVGGLGVGALIGWGFSHARGTITRRLGDVAPRRWCCCWCCCLLPPISWAKRSVSPAFWLPWPPASPPISPTWSAAATSANACRPKAPGAWWKRPSTAPSSCCWACSCHPSSACRCIRPAMTGGFWSAMWPRFRLRCC
jgi:hypothetical protein